MTVFKRRTNRARRAFTLIELMVAISVSVILLSVLAMVFRISTGATRAANAKVAMIERSRTINIRMRQEIGSMLPILRTTNPPNWNTFTPCLTTFQICSPGTPPTTLRDATTGKVGTANVTGLTPPDATKQAYILIFSTATTQDGKPVSIDVKYEYIPGPAGNPEKGVLVRWRDAKVPPTPLGGAADFDTVKPTPPGTGNWINMGNPPLQSDIMLNNVRAVKFTAIDPPAPPNNTQLNPRLLPAGIRLDVMFGPDSGDVDAVEMMTMSFPVYRGL